MVRLAVADRCLDTVAGYEPSYMTAALPDDIDGRISGAAHMRIAELAQAATVVAIGPGLGRSPDLDRLVAELYTALPLPMVCDADAMPTPYPPIPNYCRIMPALAFSRRIPGNSPAWCVTSIRARSGKLPPGNWPVAAN